MTSDETIRKDVMIESLALRLWDEGLLRPEWQAVQVVTALLGWLEEDGMLAPAPLREEWAFRYARSTGQIVHWECETEADARGSAVNDGDQVVRRYVTDWAKNDG